MDESVPAIIVYPERGEYEHDNSHVLRSVNGLRHLSPVRVELLFLVAGERSLVRMISEAVERRDQECHHFARAEGPVRRVLVVETPFGSLGLH